MAGDGTFSMVPSSRTLRPAAQRICLRGDPSSVVGLVRFAAQIVLSNPYSA